MDAAVTAVVIVLGDTREATALRKALPTPGAASLAEARPSGSAPIVIDARHPFDVAPPPSVVADIAPSDGYLRIVRPAWRPSPDDDWRVAVDAGAARAALDPSWKRVFLTLGRDLLAAFDGDRDRFYLVRVRGGDACGAGLDLVNYGVTTAEGPYTVEAEADLMASKRIDALVTRNVGGDGAFPKVAAASRLGVPVVMVSRPATAAVQAGDRVVETVDEALTWAQSRIGATP